MLALIAALAVALANSSKAEPRSNVYRSEPIQWEESHNPAGWQDRTAHIAVLILDSDGRMTILAVNAISTERGRLALLYQSGVNAFTGHWRRADNHLLVDYQQVAGSTSPGGAYPSARKETWPFSRATGPSWLASEIRAHERRFVPCDDLDDYEALRRVIQGYWRARTRPPR
jgi:hypothetical protein